MSTTCLKNVENHWKLKTTSANKLFDEGNYSDALNEYKDALYRAEVLTINTDSCQGSDIPIIQVYMISCNNIANTYQELGELNEGSKILKKAVYYLIYLAKENISYINEIKSELKRAVINYFDFTQSIEQSSGEDEQLLLAIKDGLLAN